MLTTIPVTTFPNSQLMTNANFTGINPNFIEPTFAGADNGVVTYNHDGSINITMKAPSNGAAESVISTHFRLNGSFDVEFDAFSGSITGSTGNIGAYHNFYFYNSSLTYIGNARIGYFFEANSGMSYIKVEANGAYNVISWDASSSGRGSWGTWRLTFNNNSGRLIGYVKPRGTSSWVTQSSLDVPSFVNATTAAVNFTLDNNYDTEVLKLNNYKINSVDSIEGTYYQSIMNDIANYSVSDNSFDNRYIRYSEFIPSLGSLYTWGANDQGQIGNGTNTFDSYSPQPIGSNNFITLGSTQNSWYAIDTNGAMWAWGNNGSGQLGTNDLTMRTVPTNVGTFTKWKSVSKGCYSAHVLAISIDGKLYSAGYGTQGQLGLGNNNPSTQGFTQVGTDTNWKQVATGNTSSFAINASGQLFSCGQGSNWTGILGLGDNSDYNTFHQIGTDTNWVKVSAGFQHAMAINAGHIYGWGRNDNGQLGNTSYNPHYPMLIDSNNWIDISCGGYFTMAIRADGSLWGTGINSYGELGQGDSGNQKTSFTQVGALTNWKSIVCGWDHAIGVKTDGTIWAWGFNGHGELGFGNVGERHTPNQIINPSVQWMDAACGNEDSIAIGY